MSHDHAKLGTIWLAYVETELNKATVYLLPRQPTLHF